MASRGIRARAGASHRGDPALINRAAAQIGFAGLGDVPGLHRARVARQLTRLSTDVAFELCLVEPGVERAGIWPAGQSIP